MDQVESTLFVIDRGPHALRADTLQKLISYPERVLDQRTGRTVPAETVRKAGSIAATRAHALSAAQPAAGSGIAELSRHTAQPAALSGRAWAQSPIVHVRRKPKRVLELMASLLAYIAREFVRHNLLEALQLLVTESQKAPRQDSLSGHCSPRHSLAHKSAFLCGNG